MFQGSPRFYFWFEPASPVTPPTRAGRDACSDNSENPWFTQCLAPLGILGDPDMTENPTNDMTQNAKAKSPKARHVGRIALNGELEAKYQETMKQIEL